MIILALSICSLFKFELLTSVIFTIVFSLCGYAAVIYFKLKFAFYEDECEYIRGVISKLSGIKNRLKARFSKTKRFNPYRLGTQR